MHLSEVIKKLVLTEKTHTQMAAGYYTLVVNRKANQVHIRKAFEMIFEVKVEKINIINSKPKSKRLGRYEGKTSFVKKAVIKLANGARLNLLSDEKTNN